MHEIRYGRSMNTKTRRYVQQCPCDNSSLSTFSAHDMNAYTRLRCQHIPNLVDTTAFHNFTFKYQLFF